MAVANEDDDGFTVETRWVGADELTILAPNQFVMNYQAIGVEFLAQHRAGSASGPER